MYSHKIGPLRTWFGLYFAINLGKSFASNFGTNIVLKPRTNGSWIALTIEYAENGGKKFKNKSCLFKLNSEIICVIAIVFKFSFVNVTPFGSPVVPPVYKIITGSLVVNFSSINPLYFWPFNINSSHDLISFLLFLLNFVKSFIIGDADWNGETLTISFIVVSSFISYIFSTAMSNPINIFDFESFIFCFISSCFNLGSIALTHAPILFKAYKIYTISGVVAIAIVTISPFLMPNSLNDLATISIFLNNSL